MDQSPGWVETGMHENIRPQNDSRGRRAALPQVSLGEQAGLY